MAALQRIIVLNHRHRRRREVVYRNAFIRTTFSPLDVFSDEAIIRKYRLTRATIQELMDFVHPRLVRATRRNFALSPAVQLLAALDFYASGSFNEVSRDELGLSRASISRAVTAVTKVLLQLTARMTFPTLPEEIAKISQGFHSIANIPQVIGVVNSTLVQIARPSGNALAFFCSKGFPALNVQVVCDNRGAFTDIVAKWPGSTHKAFIWANSSLRRVAEDGGFGGCWLLGDRSYPLRPYLLTPVRQARSEAEMRFNDAHARTCTVMEKAVEMWKHRFRCVSESAGGLKLNPTKCCAVVVVTALLHNMAVAANAPLPEDLPEVFREVAEDDPMRQDGMHPSGLDIQRNLVENIFGP